MAIGVDDAIIAAGISAAASIAGGVMANQTSAGNAAAGNFASFQIADANRRDAQHQYDENYARALEMDKRNKEYATQMSNTAYQRAMFDMRTAGLNPVLAYQQGGATSTPVNASAPSATTASSSNYNHQMPTVHNVLGPATSSAVQAAQVVQNIRQGTATIEQTNALTGQAHAQTQQSQSQARLNDTQTALSAAQTMTEAERTRFVEAETRLTRERERTQQETTAQAGNETQRQRDWGVAPNSTAAAAAAAEAAARRAGVTPGGVSDAARSTWDAIRSRLSPNPAPYSPSQTPWSSRGTRTPATEGGGFNLYP